MNNIINLLNLEGDNLVIDDLSIDNKSMTKTVFVHTNAKPTYCPLCNFKMHSRGIYQRSVAHPMLLDGYTLVINLKQRRWKCINDNCGFEANEGFNFVGPRRRFSNGSDFEIIAAMKELNKSATAIGKDLKTSASHVISTFDKYVSMERLPLSEAISVDEVNLDMDPKCKYVLVIQDFVTGDSIDMLINRRSECTEPFFSSIPIEERNKVKYLISDMYNPYISFVNKYFPNAVSVVDSFHVCQWIIRSIMNYVRSIERELISEIKEINYTMQAEGKHKYEIHNAIKLHSDKLYILKRYRWLVTKNNREIDYSSKTRLDRHFNYYMSIYQYENMLFSYYPKLKKYRDWKEKYIAFNSRNSGNPERAAIELDDLIDFYVKGDEAIFRDFALLLKKYKKEIINSFVVMTKVDPKGVSYEARLSNGPIESLNRKAKDLKRLCRGMKNFDHLRNRFLYATRKNIVWNGKINK